MSAPSVPQSSTVQQFEYVRLFISRNPAEQWVVNHISAGLAGHMGIQLGMDMDSALALLSNEGWQIVGMPGNADQFHVALQRPRR